MVKSFGEHITEIRILKRKTIRAISLNLKTMGSSKYSKIERGIQNPRNKREFDDIIQALDIQDKPLIDELESLANNFIQPKEFDSKIIEYPAFVPSHIKTEEELEEFLIKYNNLIKQCDSPE